MKKENLTQEKIQMYESIEPIWQCVIGAMFCFLCTSIGASLVFFFKKGNTNKMNGVLALAGGIMIASSFFSLLMPAIETCEENNLPIYLFVAIGFLIGGIFIVLSDKILDKFFNLEKFAKHRAFKRSIIFAGSITFHNIPEGMAIGVAFGSLTLGADSATITSAFMLALGIGLQNIPEGAAVALPLKAQGVKTSKSFFVGMLSGIVEPIFAVLAFLLCYYVGTILPFLLSFAAGAMVAVACCELIPEAVKNGKNKATIFLIIGFFIMALLDTCL